MRLVQTDETVFPGGGIDFDTWDPSAGGMFVNAREGIGNFQLTLGNESGSGGWSVALSAQQHLDMAAAHQAAAKAIIWHDKRAHEADGEA